MGAGESVKEGTIYEGNLGRSRSGSLREFQRGVLERGE
jgi:hypothetical protein